jgi:Lrp/AsnC family leucine-responsive transcriptional regulator
MGRSTEGNQLLDQINRRLLAELQADARLTMVELGRRVNLSPPAVAERIQRLERAGVIAGYRAIVDTKAVGFAIAAIVRVRPTTRQLHKIPELARELPEVVECHRITGEDCFFLKLQLRSMDDLEGILDRFAVVGQTTTSIVHSAPVRPRPLPLTQDPIA